jgi:predicted type IV restriction endonuclease
MKRENVAGKEPWEYELNPNKNNNDLKARRYLYAPLEFDNKIIPVKITVKEYKDITLGKRLYSIEAIDVEKKKKK